MRTEVALDLFVLDYTLIKLEHRFEPLYSITYEYNKVNYFI